MSINFRIIAKFCFLLVTIGFLMPIVEGRLIISTFQLNGFEYAEFAMNEGYVALGILFYGTFVFSLIGLIIGVVLLLKKNIPIFVDWLSILVCASGILYFLIEDHDGMSSGAYVMIIGLIAALIFQIISAIKTEKSQQVREEKPQQMVTEKGRKLQKIAMIIAIIGTVISLVSSFNLIGKVPVSIILFSIVPALIGTFLSFSAWAKGYRKYALIAGIICCLTFNMLIISGILNIVAYFQSKNRK